MPLQDYTHVCYILDRSGSMASVVNDVLGGFDTFIREQQAAPGTCTMSLHQFDDAIQEDYAFLPVQDLPPLRFQPRGWTALLDAVGQTIVREQEAIARLPVDRRPALVIVVIQTDGEENASREWTLQKVKELLQSVEQATEPTWKVTFLGAGLEVAQQAVAMGLAPQASASYSSAKGGIQNTSRRVARARWTLSNGDDVAGAAAAADFTDQDRDDIT